MKKYLSVLIIFVTLTSCSRRVTESGVASFYSDNLEGRKTASGETFHQSDYVAAHKTLPFGTKVKVKNLSNGKTVKVRINDRGPYVKGRIIDLSKIAAKKIDMENKGITKVTIQYKRKKNK
ncbi:septal ring lytic transglycosylase RlpA family protein [Danxiaibacter flavus]|uniref:Probable endolytic peptidoglycan transglycosylase RlpA n=1 Tax=Danxiaibacter flavus TaxID=3049108 RepID=A0ABV3ZFZ7_9BACT|nr:septal ring lytic transglycosylase RlpA family protein [Chitinophagaceae bacterium DXS]